MRKSLAVMTAILLAEAATFVQAQANDARLASATLRDTTGNVVGVARFTEDATGRLHVNVHVKGISTGKHGIHLHSVAACDPTTVPPFSSAGGHHNPTGHQHGLNNPLGAYSGDLPNLVVNGAGVGHLNATSDRATISAGSTTLFDANGSSVIIHVAEDDQLIDPTGNSGARIVCGVITLD